MAKSERVAIEVGERVVDVSSPNKLVFPEAGVTKLDLVRYYLAVAEGALRGAGGRPNVLKRYVDGRAGEPFFQKRAPEKRPEWVETVEVTFPSGLQAHEVVPRDAAALVWMVQTASSTSTRTRRAPRISTTPTSCGWTSIPSRTFRGARSRRSR